MRADVARNGSVNINSRESSAQVLVLYNAREILGAWLLSGFGSVLTASQLLDIGYPAPRGDAYICVQLVDRIWETTGLGLDYFRVKALAQALAQPFGSPAVTSWADLTS